MLMCMFSTRLCFILDTIYQEFHGTKRLKIVIEEFCFSIKGNINRDDVCKYLRI